MKRAAIYLRVSTQDQTTSNQEHELRRAAERANWQVVRVYKDHGISGAKGRNGRPAFDSMCRDATNATRSFRLRPKRSTFQAITTSNWREDAEHLKHRLAGVSRPC